VCIGAWAPWFSLSVYGVTAHIGGLNSHLDGRYAMALGVLSVLLGAVGAAVPHGASVRYAAAIALIVVGVVGVILIRHQYLHLTHHAISVGRATGLSPLAKFFDVHAGASWGLWLDGISFGGIAGVGLVALVR
jgi:hypothetical protein